MPTMVEAVEEVRGASLEELSNSAFSHHPEARWVRIKDEEDYSFITFPKKGYTLSLVIQGERRGYFADEDYQTLLRLIEGERLDAFRIDHGHNQSKLRTTLTDTSSILGKSTELTLQVADTNFRLLLGNLETKEYWGEWFSCRPITIKQRLTKDLALSTMQFSTNKITRLNIHREGIGAELNFTPGSFLFRYDEFFANPQASYERVDGVLQSLGIGLSGIDFKVTEFHQS